MKLDYMYKDLISGTSLALQWLRLHLPMQGELTALEVTVRGFGEVDDERRVEWGTQLL